MKRDSVRYVRIHEAWDPLPLYAAVTILDDPAPVAFVPFSTKKHIKTFEYRIHLNTTFEKINFFAKKINNSVR